MGARKQRVRAISYKSNFSPRHTCLITPWSAYLLFTGFFIEAETIG